MILGGAIWTALEFMVKRKRGHSINRLFKRDQDASKMLNLRTFLTHIVAMLRYRARQEQIKVCNEQWSPREYFGPPTPSFSFAPLASEIANLPVRMRRTRQKQVE